MLFVLGLSPMSLAPRLGLRGRLFLQAGRNAAEALDLGFGFVLFTFLDYYYKVFFVL